MIYKIIMWIAILSVTGFMLGCQRPSDQIMAPNHTGGDIVDLQIPSSGELINYIETHITQILEPFPEKPKNGRRFAYEIQFVATGMVYVEFEDGHMGYSAILDCKQHQDMPSCDVISVSEQGRDKRLIYTGALFD